MSGRGGRPRGTPHRRSARATTRAATAASAATRNDGVPAGSDPSTPAIPLQELHSLMSLISEQLRSHSSLAPPASSGVTVVAPVEALTQTSFTTAMQTSTPPSNLKLPTSSDHSCINTPSCSYCFFARSSPFALYWKCARCMMQGYLKLLFYYTVQYIQLVFILWGGIPARNCLHAGVACVLVVRALLLSCR